MVNLIGFLSDYDCRCHWMVSRYSRPVLVCVCACARVLCCAIINHRGHVRADPNESWIVSLCICIVRSPRILNFSHCVQQRERKKIGSDWMRKANAATFQKKSHSDHHKSDDHVHTARIVFRVCVCVPANAILYFSFSRACVAQRRSPPSKRLNESMYNCTCVFAHIYLRIFVPINRLSPQHEFHWNRNADNYPIRFLLELATTAQSMTKSGGTMYPTKY